MSMAEKVKKLEKRVKELEERKPETQETHLHFHYVYPQYVHPYYVPQPQLPWWQQWQVTCGTDTNNLSSAQHTLTA